MSIYVFLIILSIVLALFSDKLDKKYYANGGLKKVIIVFSIGFITLMIIIIMTSINIDDTDRTSEAMDSEISVLADEKYHLTIAQEDILSIEVSYGNRSAGYQHADGSVFEMGENVHLELLDGIDDLSGVCITGFGVDGTILLQLSFPEDM